MDLLFIAFKSFSSIAVLFILTKLIGSKQISELNMFDYINSITIGSIAAEMATDLEKSYFTPIVAMVVYAAVVLLINLASSKSLKCRRFFNGKSVVLFDNGKLCEKNFAKTKLDINEFLTACRTNGYFDISQLETVFIEPNGRLSFLPKSQYRPVNPDDLSLTAKRERPSVSIILDGQILYENLKKTGNNEKWLENQLKYCNVKDVKNVFYAFCADNKLTVYEKTDKKTDNDIFQ